MGSNIPVGHFPRFSFLLNVSDSDQTLTFLPNKIVWFHLNAPGFGLRSFGLSKTNSGRRSAEGYEAVKFRFLLFL